MGPKGLPVFPNWFPYNDMLLDGHLGVDEWEGVKTRSWEWDYRGSVLLYNSGRTAQPAVAAYNYKNMPSRHKVIVGVGELIDVRPLTTAEAIQMVANFNNRDLAELKKAFKDIQALDIRLEDAIYRFYEYGPYIAPFRIGFFFKNLKRFREPVPFNWPAGPIKPIFTKIFTGSKLYKEIKQAGL